MSKTNGQLVLITGPMCAGKSTELGRRYSETSKRARIIAPDISKDAQTGYICPRTGGKYSASFVDRLSQDLAIALLAVECEQVFIDEGQFFNAGDELASFCRTLIDSGVDVCVAALDMDFLRVPWPAVTALRSLSPTVELLRARCSGCSQPAVYSAKVMSSASSSTEGVIDVHAEYMPLCHSCYLKNKGKKQYTSSA